MLVDWKALAVLLSTLAAPYALVLASPGPNLLIVMRAGLLPSIRRPLAAALGIACGAAAATGLAAFCASLLLPVKNIEIVGTLLFACILVRSALRLLSGGLRDSAEIEAAARRGVGRLFLLGFAAAMTNPVTISFFLTSFVAHPTLRDSLPLVCLVVFAMAASWFAAVGLLFAHSAGGLVSSASGRFLRRGLAVLMMAVAAFALWRLLPP